MIDKIVGGYRILDKLGEGGMGAVFRGIDVMLEREVAIKSIRPELTHDPTLIERFRTEAVALAKLNHPNIVTLYNFFREGDQYYMVLELVHGETLDKLIKHCGALPWQTAVPIIRQALAGLEHAHILRVIHRDIKPANLILTRTGVLKLMDFGIARILETTRLTRTGRLFGTLEYMSPEQIQGRTIDARSDIYSVGVVLYEMLTGHIPFERDSDFELIKSQVEEYPASPRTFIPQLPTSLEALVIRALAKAPEDRFPNAGAFGNALEGILKTAPSVHEFEGNFSPLPETRFYSKPPSAEQAARPSQASSNVEMASPIQPPARKDYLSYLKRYPGVIVLLILLSIAAALVGIAYRLQAPWINETKSPALPAEQADAAAKSNSSIPEADINLPPDKQARENKEHAQATAENATPAIEAEPAINQQEQSPQQEDSGQKPQTDNGQAQQLNKSPSIVRPSESTVSEPAATVPRPTKATSPPAIAVPSRPSITTRKQGLTAEKPDKPAKSEGKRAVVRAKPSAQAKSAPKKSVVTQQKSVSHPQQEDSGQEPQTDNKQAQQRSTSSSSGGGRSGWKILD